MADFSGSKQRGAFVGAYFVLKLQTMERLHIYRMGDMISVDVENGKIDAIDVDFERTKEKEIHMSSKGRRIFVPVCKKCDICIKRSSDSHL